jgi:hypothetical protein
VVLDLEFKACAGTSNQHAADDTGLRPDLSILTHDDRLRLLLDVLDVLDDDRLAARGDEPALALPHDRGARADLVPHAGEALPERDARGRARREREAEEEGGLAAARGPVAGGQRGVRMREHRVRRRERAALEDAGGVHELRLGRMVARRQLWRPRLSTRVWVYTGRVRTLDGEELDLEDGKPEALVRAALHLHPPGDRAACNGERVREAHAHAKLGVMRRRVHRLRHVCGMYACVRWTDGEGSERHRRTGGRKCNARIHVGEYRICYRRCYRPPGQSRPPELGAAQPALFVARHDVHSFRRARPRPPPRRAHSALRCVHAHIIASQR